MKSYEKNILKKSLKTIEIFKKLHLLIIAPKVNSLNQMKKSSINTSEVMEKPTLLQDGCSIIVCKWTPEKTIFEI